MPVRTAFAVEPRDGRLCVFMPPTERLEDYLELLAAVEATAAELAMPVGIEGYPPPSDPRINVIKVTPDPGRDRGQYSSGASLARRGRDHAAVYEEARLTRLGTDKFMIDGRHTGTGGGNHMVLGGADAGRQPVPAAARSAQEHRRYIGSAIRRSRICSPACSSVRPARRRASTKRARTCFYELEIALAQVPAPGARHRAAAVARRPPVSQHLWST